MSNEVRAVRNNNPGNIKKKIGDKVTPWQGLMPISRMNEEQAEEKIFAVFESPMWGFRALAMNLITYQDKRRAPDGSVIDTVEEAISRWAPPGENNTEAYIRHVCEITRFQRKQVLNFHEYASLMPLAKAISIHECGGWFFSQEDLDAGLRQAGVLKPPAALPADRTIKATTVAAGATAASVVAETIQQLTPAAGVLREMASWTPQIAGLIVLVVLGIIIWQRYDDWKRAKA
jgi:hypothetical protein